MKVRIIFITLLLVFVSVGGFAQVNDTDLCADRLRSYYSLVVVLRAWDNSITEQLANITMLELLFSDFTTFADDTTTLNEYKTSLFTFRNLYDDVLNKIGKDMAEVATFQIPKMPLIEQDRAKLKAQTAIFVEYKKYFDDQTPALNKVIERLEKHFTGDY